MSAAESVLGGVIEKNGDKLPESTIEKLKSVVEKLNANGGRDDVTGNSLSNGQGSHNGVKETVGHDTVVGGGYDSLSGGTHDTDLGSLSLPDLSDVHVPGSVAPVDNSFHASQSNVVEHVETVAVKATTHVDLTLTGSSIAKLTKALSKFQS